MWKKSRLVETWKNEDLRDPVSEVGEELVPNPAGFVELLDEDLEFVVGGQAAPEQTGTNGAGCECVRTQTAVSGGGSCWCTCPSGPQPVEPVLV